MFTNAALDQIATAIDAIVHSPDQPTIPPAIAGTREPATIAETKSVLRDRRTSPTVRDHIWRHLVNQTRHNRHPWQLITTGLALPGLRHAAARVARIHPADDPGDSDAEVLAGFVDAVNTIDIAKTGICSRLCQRAFSAGRTFARRQIRIARTQQNALESRIPTPASGHVDLVLAQAIHEKVITREDATIIGATRLDHQPMELLATNSGATSAELRHRRQNAETALTEWITSSG